MSNLVDYFQLSAEQRRFVRKQQITDTRTPEQWLTFFQAFEVFESDFSPCEDLDWYAGWFRGSSIVAATIAVFWGTGVLAFSDNPNDGHVFDGTLWILAGVVVPTLIFLLRPAFIRSRRLQSIVNPLLAVLREDMKPRETVMLSVDLRQANRSKNCITKRYVPLWGRKNLFLSTFANNWLNAEAKLADGTQLAWEFTDHIRSRARIKSQTRRKARVEKIKIVMKTQVKLQVGLRTDRYLLKEPLPPETDLKCEKDDQRLWLKLRQTYGDDPASRFDVLAFVRMVRKAFTHVRPVGGVA